jgi:predicted ATP-grasp superfamily ATP-dependent carboligase
MRPEPPTLLVVGNSGRLIAESAVRGGYAVAVLDGFCDLDTRAIAVFCALVPFDGRGLDPAGLRARAEQMEAGRLIYGAGLEQSPATIAWLAERFRLVGNGTDVLLVLRHPARFFSLLDALGILYPETRLTPPQPGSGGRWLVKQAGTSGGLGVRWWREAESRSGAPEPCSVEPTGEGCRYYQRFLAGPVISILFIADGRRCRVIGYSRLLAPASLDDRPFLYAGAIGRAELTAPQGQAAERAAAALTATLGLRGINNLDFVLHDGRLHLLELNPRPPATLGLYEADYAGGWIRQQVRACCGELPMVPPGGNGTIRGHRIVYAGCALAIPAHIRWPAWAKDRPAPGTRLSTAAPVCTVLASGHAPALVERRLAERAGRILGLIRGTAVDQADRERPDLDMA